MPSEWVDWHKAYANDSNQARRLVFVQNALRGALDSAPPGSVRLISLCAGDGRDVLGVLPDHVRGRDVLGVLPDHVRGRDVKARLIELDPTLLEEGRRMAVHLGLDQVEFVLGDASTTTACKGMAPADIVLLCGIFGNISDEDIRNTIDSTPCLCSRGATVIWTRGRFEPDLTPTIRRWFSEAGFHEVSFVPVPESTASVGSERLAKSPRPFQGGVRLFTFLPSAERPSSKGKPPADSSGPKPCPS